jgi:hypothetical protein
MRRLLRFRPKAATIISVVALFFAMTGTAVAATGGTFILGKANTASSLTSLSNSAGTALSLSSSTGTALRLQAGHSKAPFSVNSSVQVSELNASLLGGLTAGQFVQGRGQSRSFGFTMSTASFAQEQLLPVPGFGTLNALCGPNGSGGAFAEVTFFTDSQGMDRFTAALSGSNTAVGNNNLTPNTNWLFAQVDTSTISAVWEQQILRYATGSGRSQTTHIATIDVMVDVTTTTCDFDTSATTSAAGP